MRDECEHGSLRRKCELCDLATELAEERAKFGDLRLRLMKATTAVDALAMASKFPPEKRRLEGKSEGLRLALSYVEEAIRG